MALNPTSSSSELLCPNWVFSNTSNVHACKDRGWFTDYTPFDSSAGTLMGNSKIPVLGIGTVIIATKKTPGGSGSGIHGQLILHDVLHVPSALCNIIGLTEEDCQNFEVTFGAPSPKSNGAIKSKEGRPIAYFDAKKPLLQIKLSGPPHGPIVGPSVFTQEGHYHINVRWDESEVTRWKEYKRSKQSSTPAKKRKSTAAPQSQPLSPGYTQKEKTWLKIHYGNEWKFLSSYGLSIYDEEERDEGRRMVRSFMAKQGPEGMTSVNALLGKDDDFEYDNSEEDINEEAEDAIGALIDCMFDERCIHWIRKHHGTPAAFMRSYGLRFCDPHDCEIARDIFEDLLEGQP